ncbi:terminase small subunit [Paenibacillus solani]|uniref:terminase small subunit n=1 Tax=Paenibacillus solani TaxID=1705565 RepID=UPI003D2A1B5D
MALTAKQHLFVQEYLIDLNATRAYKAAGYSVKSDNAAGVEGHRLLRNPKIAAAVKEAMDKRSERTEITADMVLERWWTIANADPNDLIYHRRVCCRYCFGQDHAYQWVDKEEYLNAVQIARQMEKPLPVNNGGYGFDSTLRPHPKCPRCHGEGFGEIHATDTRDLSPQARMLYAGVKQTQSGFEIKMRDQDKALENVARHLGMFNDKMELTGKDGGALQVIFDKGMTNDE